MTASWPIRSEASPFKKVKGQTKKKYALSHIAYAKSKKNLYICLKTILSRKEFSSSKADSSKASS